MKTQEELLTRRSEIREEMEDDALPEKYRQALKAQEELLTWILEGDALPEEYITVGRLKFSGEVFTEVILAGKDSGGRIYPAARAEETAEYVLARRPSRREWEEEKSRKSY